MSKDDLEDKTKNCDATLDQSGRVVRSLSFGSPPLLLGEDQQAYDQLRARVFGAINPIDFIEEIWVDEAVRYVWEARRLQRYKNTVMNSAAMDELIKRLDHLIDERPKAKSAKKPDSEKDANPFAKFVDLLAPTAGAELVNKRIAGDPAAAKKVDKIIAAAGLTMEAIMATAMPRWIDAVERLEPKIAHAERGFNNRLGDIERHRSGFGQQLRRAPLQLEGADYRVIDRESKEKSKCYEKSREGQG